MYRVRRYRECQQRLARFLLQSPLASTALVTRPPDGSIPAHGGATRCDDCTRVVLNVQLRASNQGKPWELTVTKADTVPDLGK